MSRLQGKVALISGAARGMGRETAELFAREGATVYAGDVIEAQDADASPVTFVKLDVTDEQNWRTVVESIVAAEGHLDILVNNAGVIQYEPILETSLESWNRLIAIDQTGVFLGMKSALPALIATGNASIVNFSSISGTVATKGAAAYHAAKAAVANMSRNVALEHATDGVRVNSVHPGFIHTPMTANQAESVSDVFRNATPMGRGGEAIEVANAVLFLASDEASFITGSELNVDGGYLAQ